MSLTAGFDVVIEISKATMEKLMLSKVQIDNQYVISGNPLAPPFELKIPVSLGALSGFAYLVVTDPNGVQLADLTPDERAVINISFTGSSIVAGNLNVSPLAGTLSIGVPLLITGQMNDPCPNTYALIADLTNTQCNLELVAASTQTLAQALPPFQTPAQFVGLANTVIQEFLASLSNPQPVFQSFTIDPNRKGNLGATDCMGNPRPQFMGLLNHNIPDPTNKALGLFGMLIPGNQVPNISTKNTTAILPGEDVALSLSPQAFHQVYFCPALATKMLIGNETPAALPPPCGLSPGKDFHDIVWTSIADSLGTGHINIDGALQKSGICYDASGPFHAEATLVLSGGQLTPQPTIIDTSNIAIDISFWCYLAVGAIGLYIYGALGATIADVLLYVIVHVVFDAVSISVQLPSVSIPTVLPGLVIDDSSISPEGFTLLGKVTVTDTVKSTGYTSPSLVLTGGVGNLTVTQIGTGSYDYQCGDPAWCVICPSHCCFEYAEYRQHQSATLQAITGGFFEPTDFEWQVGIPGDMRLLSGASGMFGLRIPCQYPQPLPAGTTVSQRVLIRYTITKGAYGGDTLVLEPDPYGYEQYFNYGNFVLNVELHVSDPTGQWLDEYAPIQFQGDAIQFSGEYDAYMAECARRLNARWQSILAQAGHLATTPQPVPPEGGWNPEGVSSLVGIAAILGPAAQQQVLAQANMRFGPKILVQFASGKGLRLNFPTPPGG